MDDLTVLIRATAVGWQSTNFPRWLDVHLLDAECHGHRVIEKEPVLLSDPLPADVTVPLEIWVPARSVASEGGRVEDLLSNGIETTDGIEQLTVSAEDVRWL